jgi:hypothetical protein
MALKDKLGLVLKVCCWGWLLPSVDYQTINDKLPRNIFVCGRARDTPPPPVFACNVAIFLRKLVTCTTMWAYPLGNPCIKRGGCVYCICIPEVYTPIVLTKSRSVKIFLIYFYFLDYFYVNHYYKGNKALIKAHAIKYYISFKCVFGFIN